MDMAEDTKPMIPTYQVEIVDLAPDSGENPQGWGASDTMDPEGGIHGILRAEPGLAGRAGDRPEPAPARSVLHGAVPGAARGRRTHVRTGPVRLVADRGWARGHAAGLLVGGAARATGHRDPHRHPLCDQVVE